MLYKYSFLDSKTDCSIAKRITFVGELNKCTVFVYQSDSQDE